MHVCFLLDNKDFSKIKHGNIENLPLSIQGYIKALAKSESIIHITIGLIKENSKKNQHINKLLKYSRNPLKILDILALRFSKLIYNFDAVLNSYKIKGNLLNKNDLKKFNKKVINTIFLDQTRKNLFSYTTIENKQLKGVPSIDFFFRGSGLKIERGEILNKFSKFGVLSLHHGDNSKNRGGPIGFWEIYFKESSGITAQFLTENLDGGRVIYISKFRTHKNYLANIFKIYSNSCTTLLIAFKKIHNFKNSKNSFSVNSDLTNYSLYTRNFLKFPKFYLSLPQSINYLIWNLLLITIKIIRKLLNSKTTTYDNWGILITNNKNKILAKWKDISSLNQKKSKNNWFADPFFIKLNKKYFLLYEEYFWKDKKGVISCVEIYKNNKAVKDISFGKSFTLLRNNYHLSYPYTFLKNNNAYFIPENSNKGSNLYQLELTKKEGNCFLKAKLIKNLLKGRCIDPSYINFENYDYLFVTERDDSRETLHLYYCKDILKDKLNIHPSSPVCIDHTLGRGAGRIYIDSEKRIIRPSQIMEKRYGEGVVFSEIILNPSYCEIKNIENKIIGDKHSKFKSIHHVDFLEELIAIDYQKHK